MVIPSNFSFFFYDKILAIIISIPPTFPVLMPLPELLEIFGHWREKGGVWEGSARSEAEEKKTCNFQTQSVQLVHIYQAFVNILLKIHYSFPIKY